MPESPPSPMLARLSHDHEFSDDYVYERKYDGVRVIAVVSGGEVRLWSRNGKDRTETWPEIVEALEEQAPHDLILDGEIVTFEGDLTSFSKLQERMQIRDAEEARASDVEVVCYVFDLIEDDGQDFTDRTLVERKNRLKEVLDFDDPLRFCRHRSEDGEAFFEEACRKGWEGILVKERDSQYVHARSSAWLKYKCEGRQEFVIAGYTDPEGERIGFGALLVGYYDGDDLRYAGKVGTGYDDEFLEDFSSELEDAERETSPFVDEVDEDDVHFVTPRFVGEVGFTEWTDDGRLRHPRFIGLRDDKDPEEVVREGEAS